LRHGSYTPASNIDYQEKWVPNSRGALIYRQLFIPKAPIKAVIGLFHGFGDHSSSQSSISSKFTDAGYAVVTLDHEGHGKSDGLHAHVTDLKLLAADAADVVLDEMRHQAAFANKPLFLFGESMGGAIAFHVSTSDKLKDYLKGIILSAPMVDIAPETRPSWLTEKILEQLSHLFPTLAITPLPDIASNAFKNQDLLHTIKSDPLSYRLKVRLGSALAMKNAVEEISASMHRLSCPVLILHGEEDKVRAFQLISCVFYNNINIPVIIFVVGHLSEAVGQVI
jgi:acylglycerol lipase